MIDTFIIATVFTYWYVVCVDVVGALFIIHRLKFEARMIIWQNVSETILGTIARQVCGRTWLLSANMLQLLKFFWESKVGVSRHHTIVFREVFQPDWTAIGNPNSKNNNKTTSWRLQANLLWWHCYINVVADDYMTLYLVSIILSGKERLSFPLASVALLLENRLLRITMTTTKIRASNTNGIVTPSTMGVLSWSVKTKTYN